MKKILALLFVAIFVSTVLAFAAADGKPELRPSQKLMQARAAQRGEIEKSLNEKNFGAAAAKAGELAAETKKTAENIPNPLGKEITLAISVLAAELAEAAGRQDGGAAKLKLDGIKAKCGECHKQIRDKK